MSKVEEFEQKIAEFFGAPYAVAVDSCTHSVELCLRMLQAKYITSPKRTYLSIPMLANKLGIELRWKDEDWVDYYEVYPGVYDAAVLWKPGSYIPGKLMCISMQFQKHLSVGRLGVILTDKYLAREALKIMSHDGRAPGTVWRGQMITAYGFHYYITPETAQIALDKLPEAIERVPRQWTITDWPDLTELEVFK